MSLLTRVVPSESTAVDEEEQDYEDRLSPSPPHISDDDCMFVFCCQSLSV